MDKLKHGKKGKKTKNSYTALKMEFAINVSQDSSLQKSMISTFSQCSQQKFLIHSAWNSFGKKKKKSQKHKLFFIQK